MTARADERTTPDALATAPTNAVGARRADVQGLRAVAVLLVVAFHAGLDVPGGFVGVDVFFVISGFVITGMLLREAGRTGSVSFAAFYARRVRRILPALALTVTVVALASLGAVSEAERAITARTGAAAAASVANISLYRSPAGYFDPAETLNPLLHMWSLSVEEQFYLFFPALLVAGFVLARRRARSSRPRLVTAGIVGIVAVASFALCAYATTADTTIAGIAIDERFAFYLAPTRAWEFAVGALLALAGRFVARQPRALAVASGVVGAVLVGYAAFAFSADTRFPGTAALVPVLGTVLLIAAGTATTAGLSRPLAIRPMTWIGDLSYSWYLWHWPLIVFAAALFPQVGGARLYAAILSLGVAWVAWRYVENPFRHDASWRGRRAVALAAVCVAVPVVASVGLRLAPDPPRSSATRRFLHATSARHADDARGCNLGRVPSAQPAACTWPADGADGSGGGVVLIGDSNAGHFTEPLARAANELGRSFTVATLPQCPPADLVRIERGRRDDRCRRFLKRSVADLVAQRPEVVVLAASSPMYLHSSGVTFEDPVSGERSGSVEGKARIWNQALARTLAELRSAGIATMVVHPVPQWVAWDGRSCAAARVYLAPRTCGTTQTADQAETFRREAVLAEASAAREAQAIVLDPFGAVCATATCRTNRGDRWVYRDGRHLTVPAALELTDEFVEALLDATRRR